MDLTFVATKQANEVSWTGKDLVMDLTFVATKQANKG